MEVDVDSLNRRMCEFASARLEAMGPDAGGFYNYYTHLAQRGTMLRPEEIAVAEYVDRVFPRDRPALELCAGAAQLGHLLALAGRPVSAVEIDPKRHKFAVELGAHVGSACELVLGRWQDLALNSWHLLVTINAATTQIVPADADWLRAHAKSGGEFIIRPRQFGAAGIPVGIPGLAATQVHDDIYHYRRL